MRLVIGAILGGLSLGVALWLAEELRCPYSGVRLALGEVFDRVKGEA